MDNSSSIQVKPNETKIIDKVVSFGKIKKIYCEQDYVIVEYEAGKVLVGDYGKIIRLNFFITPENYWLDSDIIKLKRVQLNYQVAEKPARIITSANYEVILNDEGGISIQKNKIILLQLSTSPMIVNDQITIKIDTLKNCRYFGFGEKPGQILNKKGTKTSNWSTDIYAPHCEINQEMYGAINFNIINQSFDDNLGIFIDNPSRVSYDMATDLTFKIRTDFNAIDLYYIPGPTMKEVISTFTTLTGKTFLPPKWALGHHQSRHSYGSEEKLLEVINLYQKYELPLAAIHLDILYMIKYRVFTLNNKAYPNLKKIIADLLKQDLYIIPIVDLGVAISDDYAVYQDGCEKDLFIYHDETKTSYETGEVWPGECVFPDMTNIKTRNWWGEQHQFYTDLGIKAIWNDMNEPAVFCPTKTVAPTAMHQSEQGIKKHQEIHNKYGYYSSLATYEGLKKLLAKDDTRPFLVTRSAYAGSQQYATVWTGDNFSYWWQLKQSLPMCLNLSLSGFNMVGCDIGGFAEDSSGELLTRWYQANVFFPFFRNHNALICVDQEPWAFGIEYLMIIKKYIQLRYKFLPTLYSLAYQATQNGIGMIRPLFLEDGLDVETYKISDQYFLGANILVAPILEQEKTHRLVYLPKGKWFDYWTNKIISGAQYLPVTADLTELPIFIRDNSIFVKTKEDKTTNYQTKEIYVYSSADETVPSFDFFDDDGKTFAFLKGQATKIKIKYENKKLVMEIETGYGLDKDSFKGYCVTDKKQFELELVWVENEK